MYQWKDRKHQSFMIKRKAKANHKLSRPQINMQWLCFMYINSLSLYSLSLNSLDSFLKAAVQKVFSYVTGTTDFINKIQTK